MKAKRDGEPMSVVLPEYLEEGTGIPVLLRNSVKQITRGDGETGVIIPDLAGLESAIAVARITNAAKLTGVEIKFLRKALGLKAVALAKFLDVTPETLSRWETGRETISTNPERLLRLRVLRALRAKAPGVKANSDQVLDMRFNPMRLANEVLSFERKFVVVDGSPEETWFYLGAVVSSGSDTLERRFA